MDFPDFHASRTPNKAAYVVGEIVVTYREMVEKSIRIAHLLRGQGLAQGDVAALLLPNMPGLLDVAWACQRSGLRYVAISDRLTAAEIAYILDDSGAQALFTCRQYAAQARAAVAEVRQEIRIYGVDGEAPGIVSLEAATKDLPTIPGGFECEGADLLYSSGTTGRPKGVATHCDFLPLGNPPGTAPFLQTTWHFDEHTVYLSPAPLYHAAPMRTCMTTQRFGGSVLIMEKFDAEAALTLIDEHRVTHTQMVPTMFVRLLQLPDEVRASYDVSSLRAVIHAAAPCPPTIKRAMIEWVGPIVDEYYSSTEAILMTLIRSEEALERPGSVGRAILGTPHIVDAEGNELPAGVPGLIFSEGGLEFEYLNAPEKTAQTQNGRGWRTVGDIGYLDDEGFLYLSDRREDLVLVGGVNVYPQEAENRLLEHESIADAAVFGVPHPEYGEEVMAVVQLRPGIEQSDDLTVDLIAFCRAELSAVKCPRSISFSATLPRTPTGKLLRRVLREEYQHHYV